jgi:hypothetical protein
MLGVSLLFSAAGAQWEPDVNLTNNPSTTYMAAPSNHPIVANGDSVYAVFVDDRTGKLQVYFMRSLDDGATWDSASCLSGDSANIFTPSLAVSGPAAHVAWATGSNAAIKYRRSTDAGVTWTAEETLVGGPGGRGDPCLAAEGNTVGLVWGDERDGNYNGELYLKRSGDGGQSWGPDTRLTFRSDTIDGGPCLAINGNSWHLVWTQSSWTGYHARSWYQRSTDGGASWLAPSPVALDTTSQSGPSVAVVGPSVHVCWWDGRPGEYGIHYRGSADNGATWGSEHSLSDSLVGSDYPQLAATRGNVYVAFRTWPSGQFHINYCGSTDNGQTWSAETSLTSAAGMGTSAIAASGSRVHLIVYDNREGNFELYYKRNLTAGGVKEREIGEVRRVKGEATVVRGVLEMPLTADRSPQTASLLDISGRRVLDLHTGENDVSRLSPGVYFVRGRGAGVRGQGEVRKIVVQR